MEQKRQRLQWLHEDIGLDQENYEQLGKTDSCKNMNDGWAQDMNNKCLEQIQKMFNISPNMTKYMDNQPMKDRKDFKPCKINITA